MGKHAEKTALDAVEISVDDFYKSIDPVLKQLTLVNFQLELLKGTLGVIEKNIEALLEDDMALEVLVNLISDQTKGLKESVQTLVVV